MELVIEKQAKDPSPLGEGMNVVPAATEPWTKNYIYLGVHDYIDGKNKIRAL